MRISDWSSDVCSSDLAFGTRTRPLKSARTPSYASFVNLYRPCRCCAVIVGLSRTQSAAKRPCVTDTLGMAYQVTTSRQFPIQRYLAYSSNSSILCIKTPDVADLRERTEAHSEGKEGVN